MTETTTIQGIHTAVLTALGRKLGDGRQFANGFDDDVDLVALGVVDSVGLLDVLLEVEAACGREFDPERLELEGGLTVRKLVAAFTPV